jgi:type IV pilus assembly protein PilX
MKTLISTDKSQKGAALFVSLMMLLLVTILGVTGVRLVSLEEKMAGNSYDRNIAFQAAESALREAEEALRVTPTIDLPTPAIVDNDGGEYEYPDDVEYPDCPTNGSAINNCETDGGTVPDVCPKPDKDCPARWILPSNKFSGWKNAASLGGLAGTAPQYFIEFLGLNFPCTPSPSSNCKRYRITARSNPGTGRATVMLQSVYATE